MAIRFVGNDGLEKRPLYSNPEAAKQARETMVGIGGMGAMPTDVVYRAAGANPPASVYALKDGAKSTADTKIDWTKYNDWLKSVGVDPSNINPADVERTRAQREAAMRYSPPGGVR